tara:strand:+ start:2652 stop:3263 length:612 start_codon:yes stop_codon:yes gene_type:complete
MTNTFLDLVEQRRAIKKFDDSHTLPAEDIEKLKTAIHFTPTAYNIQNYRIVIVQDKEFRKTDEFKQACWNQEQPAACSALFILCANKDAWKNPKRYWTTVSDEIQDNMAGMVKNYYDGKERVQLDEAHRSCGMAGMTLMLTAQALGYDTCPMDGFDYDALGQLIKLPENHVISFMVAVGKKAAEPFPRPTLIDRDEIFISNKF